MLFFSAYAPLKDLPALRSACRALVTDQQLAGRLPVAAEGVHGST